MKIQSHQVKILIQNHYLNQTNDASEHNQIDSCIIIKEACYIRDHIVVKRVIT